MFYQKQIIIETKQIAKFTESKLSLFIIYIMNNIEQKKEQLQCISQKDVQIGCSLNKIPSASSFMSNKFFEVTINSQKLSELFNSINEYMFQQDRKIDKISRDIQSITSSLQNKFESESRKNGLLFTKLDLRIGESANTQHCYLVDIHKKAEQRDLQLSNKIDSLRSKIGKVEDSYKQDLKNGLIYLKKEIIGETSIFKEDGTVIKKEDALKEEFPKLDFNSITVHFAEQLEKVKLSMHPIFNQLYQLKQNEKKKQHRQDMLNIVSKKQQMEAISSFQEEKGDLGNMRIIYPSTKKGGIGNKQNESNEHSTKTPNNRIRHMSYTKMSGIQEQMIQTYRQMGDKVYMLDNMMTQQSQITADLKNKMIVLDEKTMILTRKLQKNCQETAEIKNSIRRMENQKLDDRTIDQLRNHVKWNLRDMEEKIIKKCSEEDLQKQKMRVTQKLSIIHENLVQKADKGQIQKALQFIESKIKQIIFLIAAQQSEQRQGAIMKIAAKCLSCDKEVERQLQMQSNCKRDMNKQSQGQYIKSMTHRVRQRYKKEIAKTLGNQTLDD